MDEYIKRGEILEKAKELANSFAAGCFAAPRIVKAIEDAPKADVVDCPKWIGVKEKLPEENVRVLVWLKENDSYTRIDTDRLTRSSVTFWVRWGKYVTHWCPIPESLKEGAEE